MLTALVTVVSGEAYERYAEQMIGSAREFFWPGEQGTFHVLPGREGWPDATGYRYHALLENFPRARYVYMIDADMLFVGRVGSEILPSDGVGITATMHPGFVGRPIGELPYETFPTSHACVYPEERGTYFCGGFIGGECTAMRILATEIASIIDHDVDEENRWPKWHDESALNRVLATTPPSRILTPSYCYPDRDEYYLNYVWPEPYPRRIVALDKPEHERQGRDE